MSNAQLYKGFKGDEDLGDIVRVAMFSKNFPDIKSPEQMAFEGKGGGNNYQR